MKRSIIFLILCLTLPAYASQTEKLESLLGQPVIIRSTPADKAKQEEMQRLQTARRIETMQKECIEQGYKWDMVKGTCIVPYTPEPELIYVMPLGMRF